MPRAEYVTMNLRVTPEARDAWHTFAAEHGVTASALAEAIGLIVIQQGRSLSEAILAARIIMHDRLRRADLGDGQNPGQNVPDNDDDRGASR